MNKSFADLPKVVLVIVTWNHSKTVADTIESVYRQTFKNFTLVVHDNNSTDGTIEVLKRYENYPNFVLSASDLNEGFCGGNNLIISKYDFDYLLLVNPDIIMYPDYLENALSTFKSDPSIGAVCGLLIQSEVVNPVIDSAGMSLMKDRRFCLNFHGKKLGDVSIKSGFVHGLDGALPLFKREAVDQLLLNGYFFNPLFFSHKEDWDISWRMLLFGWKIYFNADAIAIHPRGFKPNNIKERGKINPKVKYDAFKNQFILILINDDKWNFLKDLFHIVPRLILITLYCFLNERKSLRAYSYIYKNRKEIFSYRRLVQQKRKISPSEFRKFYLSE